MSCPTCTCEGSCHVRTRRYLSTAHRRVPDAISVPHAHVRGILSRARRTQAQYRAIRFPSTDELCPTCTCFGSWQPCASSVPHGQGHHTLAQYRTCTCTCVGSCHVPAIR
eukprot:1512022-Rhodomonas_salina.1